MMYLMFEKLALLKGFKAIITTPTAPQTMYLLFQKLNYKLVCNLLYEEAYVANLGVQSCEKLVKQWRKEKPRIALAIKNL